MDVSRQVEISRRHLHLSSQDPDHLRNRYRRLHRGCLHGLPHLKQVMGGRKGFCLQDSTHHSRRHFLHKEPEPALPRALGLLQALVHLQVRVLHLECHQVFNSQATREPGSDEGNTSEKTRVDRPQGNYAISFIMYVPVKTNISEAKVSGFGPAATDAW